ncbi:MAG: recombinase RecT [Synergistaceae bacterium]|nr:recombinase RecT [Synergistaceae bacterium]MBR1602377.1 recombinase RecT [Synergistaceae bacterium]
MATVNGLGNNQVMPLGEKINKGVALNSSEFKSVMQSFKAQIADALPVHLKKNADKYARQAIMLFNQNPKLQLCTPVSILTALMTASGLGLDLTPQLGQCYIIPYEARKKVGNQWVTVNEAQFQLGYRGVIALAYRSDAIKRIDAQVVCEKDYFKYSKGLNPVLEHEESDEEDRGAVTHVYAVANFANGGFAFEVWPIAKVMAHAKKFSKSFVIKNYRTGEESINAKSPWATDFEAMAKKTLIMAIWKYLPLSTELLLAQAQDGSVKNDAAELAKIQDEKEIVTLSALHVQEITEGGDVTESESMAQMGETEPVAETQDNNTSEQAAQTHKQEAE